MDSLVHLRWFESIKLAAESEKDEQWLQSPAALRGPELAGPGQPPLERKAQEHARGEVRLLAQYVPDELKVLQDADVKDRDAVTALLHPATQPTTQAAGGAQPTTQPIASSGDAHPATQPSTQPAADADDNTSFRTDWHDTLHDVKMAMVADALSDAQIHYYRDTNYHDVMAGGLNGLRAVLTTHGMEKAFPSLTDEAKKSKFLAKLDDLDAMAGTATPQTEQDVLHQVLDSLQSSNSDTVNLPEEVVASEFADGALAELDPFSNMIWPSDLDEFNKTTQGEFSGVGIQIQSDRDGSLKVVTPLEDSPAFRAGIEPGSTITAINGKQAKGITLNQAVKTITGPVGTHVILTVRNLRGLSKDYGDIIRQTIKVSSVKGWSRKTGGGLGLLRRSGSRRSLTCASPISPRPPQMNSTRPRTKSPRAAPRP